MIDGQRKFAPLIDVTVPRDTPAAVEPSGRILHGEWVTYLWVLNHRVEYRDYNQFELLRYRLAVLGSPRREVEDGFILPGSVYALTATARTQESQYYSYGPVRIPLTGNVERRAQLLHFDPDRRVSLDEIEKIAPQVSRPPRLTGAISR